MGRDVAAAAGAACSAAARWAIVRRSRSGTRHQPVRQGQRLAVQRRHPQQRRQVRAGPQAVHVRLAGAGLAAEQHPDRGRRGRGSWISPDIGRRGVRRTRGAAPSGRTTTRRPTRIRARGRRASTTRGGPSRMEPGLSRGRSRPCRCSSTALPVRTRPVSVERRAAQPQPQGVPVDQRRWSVGDERMAHEHPQQRPVGQRTPPQDEAGAAAAAPRPAAR